MRHVPTAEPLHLPMVGLEPVLGSCARGAKMGVLLRPTAAAS